MDRRTFMRGMATALPVVAAPGCGALESTVPDRAALEPVLLRALAEVVLPNAIGEARREAAVMEFEAWLAGYVAVAERDHGYGTGELSYTPPDPAPGWRAQLEALDIEATRRFGQGFALIAPEDRLRLVRSALRRERGPLPDAAEAGHVAIGLIAWWTATPAANDLCHRAGIGRQTCRPLEDVVNQPEPG